MSLRSRHWRAFGVQLDELSDAQIAELLVSDPLAMRRPLFWRGQQVLIGYARAVYETLDA